MYCALPDFAVDRITGNRGGHRTRWLGL